MRQRAQKQDAFLGEIGQCICIICIIIFCIICIIWIIMVIWKVLFCVISIICRLCQYHNCQPLSTDAWRNRFYHPRHLLASAECPKECPGETWGPWQAALQSSLDGDPVSLFWCGYAHVSNGHCPCVRVTFSLLLSTIVSGMVSTVSRGKPETLRKTGFSVGFSRLQRVSLSPADPIRNRGQVWFSTVYKMQTTTEVAEVHQRGK